MSSLFHEAGFWFTVSLVLFFVLFGKKVWTPLAGLLDAHANGVRQDLDEAARLRREAEQMLEDAKRDRELALVEARSVVEHSRVQAEEMAARARTEAEDLIRQREKQAQDRITAAERAAVDEVRVAAIEAAFAASHKLIEQSVPAVNEKLIDDALAALPSALTKRVA